MRKRTLGVVLVAGLAMSGAGAFTASNTVTAVDNTTKNVAGYGNATVTGATVEAIDYEHDLTNSTLTSVSFWTTERMLDAEGSIILWDGSATPVSLGEYACSPTAGDPVAAALQNMVVSATSTKFTCTIGDAPSVEAVDSLGITVTR